MASSAPARISIVRSVVSACSSVRTSSDWVSTRVDSEIRRSASSISPRPISTRPMRPSCVSWRETNSTTPVKMHSGDSQDRSSENTTVMMAEPSSAPRITVSAAGRVIMPCPTNEDTISEVAVLDCTMAVTPMPESTAVMRVRTPRAINWRKLAPNTRKMPVRTIWMPQMSRAMAAKRFKRCCIARATPTISSHPEGTKPDGQPSAWAACYLFRGFGGYEPCTTRRPLKGLTWVCRPGLLGGGRSRLAAAQQLVRDEQRRADGDAHIGHVEGWEVVTAPVKIQKIHHIAMHQPIEYVADGPAQNAGQRKTKQLLRWIFAQLPHDEHRCHHANADKQPALPAAVVGQKRKRRARVVRTHDVEKAGDGRAVPQRVVAQDPLLGQLVQQHNHQRPEQPGPDAGRGGGGGGRSVVHVFDSCLR